MGGGRGEGGGGGGGGGEIKGRGARRGGRSPVIKNEDEEEMQTIKTVQ